MPKPTGTWKSIERAVADALSPIFGVKLFRNPLSGSNNRRDSGEPRRGDVTLPEGINAIIEVKYRSGISFHRFFDQAQDDCKKSGFPLDNAFLFSKEKGKKPILATISLPMLLKLLEVVKQHGQLDIILGPGKSNTKSVNKD